MLWGTADLDESASMPIATIDAQVPNPLIRGRDNGPSPLTYTCHVRRLWMLAFLVLAISVCAVRLSAGQASITGMTASDVVFSSTADAEL
jgi:hypothetical protein